MINWEQGFLGKHYIISSGDD